MSDGLIHCPLCDAAFIGGWCFHNVGEYQIAYSIYADTKKYGGRGFYVIKKGDKILHLKNAQTFIPVWKPIYDETQIEKYLALK